MTDLFDALLVAGETVSEEDRVVYPLASPPEAYGVLVTALKANAEVLKLEVVTEHILHQERKSKERSPDTESAMTSRKPFRRKLIRCHYCGGLGHIRKYCKGRKAEEGQERKTKAMMEGQKERKPNHRRQLLQPHKRAQIGRVVDSLLVAHCLLQA